MEFGIHIRFWNHSPADAEGLAVCGICQVVENGNALVS